VPPTAANVVEVDALPDSFPADLPIPEEIRPVAMYDGEAIASVWFESDLGRGRSQRAFERMLSAKGWVRIGGTGLGGIWDTHSIAAGRTVIVLIRMNPGTQRLLHGSNAFEGRLGHLHHDGAGPVGLARCEDPARLTERYRSCSVSPGSSTSPSRAGGSAQA
jgi:hypothetical protein